MLNSELFDIALKLFILEQLLLIGAALILFAARLIKYFRARRRHHKNIDDRIAELEELIYQQSQIIHNEKTRTRKKSRIE